MLNNNKELSSSIVIEKPIISFKDSFLRVSVFENHYRGSIFYDIVISRKIKTKQGNVYRRGANLKPSDIHILIDLLRKTETYLFERIKSSLQPINPSSSL